MNAVWIRTLLPVGPVTVSSTVMCSRKTSRPVRVVRIFPSEWNVPASTAVSPVTSQ